METDAVWTDLVEWLARIPGGTGVEDKVRLVHTEGALARHIQAYRRGADFCTGRTQLAVDWSLEAVSQCVQVLAST